MSTAPLSIGTSRICVRCRHMPFCEYQSYCQVSRSNSQRKPLAATRLPAPSSAMTSSFAASPSGTASSPEDERSPIVTGRTRIGRVRLPTIGPAARLEHADLDRRRDRLGQVGKVGEVDLQARLAVRVGRRRVEILAVAGVFLVEEAEMEIGLAGKRVGVEGDRRVRLDRQPGARRAVVILAGNRHRVRLVRADRPVAGGQLDLERRRHEILDPELDRADRRALGIDLELDRPGAHARVARPAHSADRTRRARRRSAAWCRPRPRRGAAAARSAARSASASALASRTSAIRWTLSPGR